MKPQIELVPWWTKIPATIVGWLLSLYDRFASWAGQRAGLVDVQRSEDFLVRMQVSDHLRLRARDEMIRGHSEAASMLFYRAYIVLQPTIEEILAFEEPTRALMLQYMAKIAHGAEMNAHAITLLKTALEGDIRDDHRSEITRELARLLEPDK